MREFKDEMREFKDENRRQTREMNRQWGELANRLGTLVEEPRLPQPAARGTGNPETRRLSEYGSAWNRKSQMSR